MTFVQIISISFFTVLLAFILWCIYQVVRSKLTLGTTILFASLVFFGLLCYFGILGNYVDETLENRSQFWLRKISYQGVLYSLGFFVVSGGLAFCALIIEYILPKRRT